MVNKLGHVLKNEEDANFYINSSRVGYYRPRTFAKFVETFDKNETTKMQAERISPNEDGIGVKIWIRSYGNTSYMLETKRSNVLLEIPLT